MSCWYRKIEKGVNFWPLFTARKCKSVWASGVFAPWTPTRALPWTRWRVYSAPQTPSCVQQWPTVIGSCACGATPDPVSGNKWVITKYASQFFKDGYGPGVAADDIVARSDENAIHNFFTKFIRNEWNLSKIIDHYPITRRTWKSKDFNETLVLFFLSLVSEGMKWWLYYSMQSLAK